MNPLRARPGEPHEPVVGGAGHLLVECLWLNEVLRILLKAVN